MSRTRMALCAGAWVMLLAGCASTDVAGLIGFKSDGNERVVDGSLDAVAQGTRDRLVRLGLSAEVSKKGEAVYISSATPKPNETRFALVLTREKAGQAERTRIRLEWQGRGDDGLALQILSRLEFAGGL